MHAGRLGVGYWRHGIGKQGKATNEVDVSRLHRLNVHGWWRIWGADEVLSGHLTGLLYLETDWHSGNKKLVTGEWLFYRSLSVIDIYCLEISAEGWGHHRRLPSSY